AHGYTSGVYETGRHIAGVLELGAPSEGDLVGFASGGGEHRQRGARRQPVVASGPVDHVRSEADGCQPVVSPVRTRGSLIRQLMHSVMARRMSVSAFGYTHTVGAVVHGGRTGVSKTGHAVALGGLEHVYGADHVDERPARRIGRRERNEHGGEMDDVAYPLAGE